ncbi:MAG TPA: chemotaxis protein CheB [Pricia antarctica]|uniref:protein-glutamate methylesterase n=2 Tax=root TaxID=1 RepID=A0A831VPG9_9FLAO|nr:chemotaxis protein CheB [Pricia antarctica]
MGITFRLFAVGASSGGRTAITKFLSEIPGTINAAFVVAVHGAFDTPSFFAGVLGQKTELGVVEASQGLSIEPGMVYIAKPNHHLFVHEGKILLSKGPRENLFRPSIDVLFRSAAVAYGNRCVGILLTGRLNDGTTGLEAIKKCGGRAIVQNPKTAEYSDMPGFARETVDIDYVVDLEDLAEVIQNIMHEDLPLAKEISSKLIKENCIATKIESQIATEEILGHQVPISCSTCGGPLWKMEDSKIDRYRCHVGHAFTQEALLKSQNEALEEALWVSLRTLEEKRMLLKRISNDYSDRGSKSLARSYSDKIDEVSKHIGKLRTVLQLKD